MTTQRINLFNLTRPRLAELIASWGISPSHAARLWTYLYRGRVTAPASMFDLPPRLRERLAAETYAGALDLAVESRSRDGLTQKYLLGLADDCRVETVLMRYAGRTTACLSSQVGCALGCVFCATGQMGFTRNLRASEIVAQSLFVADVLRHSAADTESLCNVVLMGMGEPLLNYDAVMDAVEILADHAGLAIAPKRITLSTVGVVPGIRRLADERRPLCLAVSLHAATQQQRAELVPAALTWPLDELMDACRYYTSRLRRKIFFEWTLIQGQNDGAEQAEALARLLAGMPAQVNVIPLNPTAGFAAAPGDRDSLDRFRTILGAHGIPTSMRQRRGIDIAAGCGQLAVADG